jgi:hypothetical protein
LEAGQRPKRKSMAFLGKKACTREATAGRKHNTCVHARKACTREATAGRKNKHARMQKKT